MNATEQVESSFTGLSRGLVNGCLYIFYLEVRRFPSNAEFQYYFLCAEGAD